MNGNCRWQQDGKLKESDGEICKGGQKKKKNLKRFAASDEAYYLTSQGSMDDQIILLRTLKGSCELARQKKARREGGGGNLQDGASPCIT